ncbi:biopolymer transporter ExbD [Roseivirga sp. BDSF3-8]|uniref:biopolymer transporter ExbD n=1 Tax=Roseivirga sp. BDSF3-8 TaxID=3241598 RepID=UPI0035318C1E
MQVEGEPLTDLSVLRDRVKAHVLNYGKVASLSDSPRKAIVSIKTDRGSNYQLHIAVLDEVQGAYYEIYGERIGMTAGEFRKLNSSNPNEKRLREKALMGIPMGISLAEPTDYSY